MIGNNRKPSNSIFWGYTGENEHISLNRNDGWKGNPSDSAGVIKLSILRGIISNTNLWLFFEGISRKKQSRWWFQIFFVFTPYLGKWWNLTSIFRMGWFNHQLAMHCLAWCPIMTIAITSFESHKTSPSPLQPRKLVRWFMIWSAEDQKTIFVGQEVVVSGGLMFFLGQMPGCFPNCV